MEWTITTNNGTVGTITLENLVFEIDPDFLRIDMDVINLSDDIMTEVAKAIQLTKIDNSNKAIAVGRRDRVWSNEPVIMDWIGVYILLQNSHHIVTSYIRTSFRDTANEWLEGDITILFNLMPEYITELKESVIKILTDKFF